MLLQISARNLYAVSEKGAFTKWEFRTGLKQRVRAGGGEAAEVSLVWSHPGCAVEISGGEIRADDASQTMAHIYTYIHKHI